MATIVNEEIKRLLQTGNARQRAEAREQLKQQETPPAVTNNTTTSKPVTPTTTTVTESAVPTQTATQAPAKTPVVAQPTYTPTVLPTYQPMTEQVNELYDAARELQLAQLKNAYDKNVVALEANRDKIPVVYQQERNAVAAESEKQKQAFNEYAAASGLNTGAGSQVELSRSNQLQGDLSALRRAEADAQVQLDNQLAMLKVDYQNAVATAIAQGEYERAAALMEEYKAAQQSAITIAQAQADENYRAYAAQQAYEQEQYNRRQAEIQAKANAEYRAAQLLQQQNATEASLEKAYIEALAQQRNDERSALEAKAKTLAQYGDFSGYKALGYNDTEIQAMRDMWLYQNDMEAYRDDEKERNGILSGLFGGGDSAGQNGGFLSNMFGNLIGGAGSGGASTPVVNNDTAPVGFANNSDALWYIYETARSGGSIYPIEETMRIAQESGIPTSDITAWRASIR